MKVVELPQSNIANIPAGLRNLADRIEQGKYGEVCHLAWIVDPSFAKIEVGLLGQCASPDAIFVVLCEAGKQRILKEMGK